MADDPDFREQFDVDLMWSDIGDGLRTHERFPELLAKTGLDAYFDATDSWPEEFCSRASDGSIVCR